MLYSQASYQSILDHMLNGFAYHKIILDQENKPVDYVFIEVNKAFEDLTGLVKEKIIGRRVTEVLPGIENDVFDWIGFYGNVALQEIGTAKSFVQYSIPLNRWYSVCVYSQEKYFFVTIFNDVTELKKKELTLTKQNEEITSLYEELSASEEELRQQYDELTEYSRQVKQSEDRLRRAQAIAHVGNWI